MGCAFGRKETMRSKSSSGRSSSIKRPCQPSQPIDSYMYGRSLCPDDDVGELQARLDQCYLGLLESRRSDEKA